MAVVNRAVSGELEAMPAGEVFMIRIDNWFDLKWLDFSGRGRVAFGQYTGMPDDPDTALDEFRQSNKTFPPFSPNRVIQERCLIQQENGSYSLDPNAPLIHSRSRST